MNNNQILKKISIANQLRHFELKEIFALSGKEFSSSRIKSFMAGSQNKNSEKLSDDDFASFMNGLILYSRGSRDDSRAVPRLVENAIVHLLDSEQEEALDQLRTLLEKTDA